MLGLGILTAVLTELIRRSGFAVRVVLFLMLPIGLTFLWPHLGLQPTGFEYAKVFSVAFGSLFISGLMRVEANDPEKICGTTWAWTGCSVIRSGILRSCTARTRPASRPVNGPPSR